MERPKRLWVGLFALMGFFLAWLPIALQKEVSIESRMFYYPLMMLLLLFALAFGSFTRRLARWKRMAGFFNAITCAVVLWVCLYGAICFVGMQCLYRERYRLDQDELLQIRTLLPNPESGTIFVPLDVRDAPARTGRIWFDHTARGGLEMFWVSTPLFRQTYRRHDVFGTHFNRWLPMPFSGANEVSVRYDVHPALEHFLSEAFEIDPAGGVRLPWARMVPFVIDEEGRVALVSNVRVQRTAAKDFEVSFDQVGAVLRRDQQPERWFTLQDTEVGITSEPVGPWHWENTKKVVAFPGIQEWQVRLPAASMHPSYPGNLDRGSMSATLAPNEEPSRLHFRATFSNWSLTKRTWGDGVEVMLYLDGEKDAPLGVFPVKPNQVDLEKRWIPISVEIPPLSQPRILYLEVGPGPAGKVEYDGCYVTSGLREFFARSTEAVGAPPSTMTAD